jgi:hypothetical protein
MPDKIDGTPPGLNPDRIADLVQRLLAAVREMAADLDRAGVSEGRVLMTLEQQRLMTVCGEVVALAASPVALAMHVTAHAAEIEEALQSSEGQVRFPPLC